MSYDTLFPVSNARRSIKEIDDTYECGAHHYIGALHNLQLAGQRESLWEDTPPRFTYAWLTRNAGVRHTDVMLSHGGSGYSFNVCIGFIEE